MTENNNGDESKERRIRDMMGLVKFCLETTAKEDPSGNALTSDNIQPMDEDRRAWLQNAISSMSIDTTQQLLENLSIVKETASEIEKNPSSRNFDVQKTCTAIENLTNLCEDLDYACDFSKLDGFSVFKPLVECPFEEIIVKACELIAALAQNNPVCQTIAMNNRLLEKLIDFVDLKTNTIHSSYTKARSYALYAISSIIRSNPEVRTHFETKLDGLSVLLDLLACRDSISADGDKEVSSNWSRKLKIRTIFLFKTLCLESNIASKFFHDKEAIKTLAEQLENQHDHEISEHLLNALNAYLSSLSGSNKAESLRSVPNMRDIIKDIETRANSQVEDHDLTDIKSICKDLMSSIDQ